MQPKEEENFVVFIQALRYANKGLQQYVNICLEDIYNGISREISKIRQQCTNYCNKKENQWCVYCTKWKVKIEKYVRLSPFKKRIRWQDIDFGILAGNDQDLAKRELFSVFVRRHSSTPVEFDIQAMLSLFQNCVYFDIGKNKSLIDSVRNIRNKHYAHTISFNISNECLKGTIDKLVQMFQHQSLRNYEISKSTISLLKKLRKRKLQYVENDTSVFCRHLVQYRNNIAISPKEIDVYLSAGSTGRRKKKGIWNLCKHIFPVVILVLVSLYFVKEEKGSFPKGCKAVDNEYPFTLDIDFQFYRSAHGKLVGRQWLLYELENEMSSSSKGIMMIAEMGYGKSAIMSHLVCQDDRRGAGYTIYQNISVFHICTFESKKTLMPGLFVKNMAGGFAKSIPRFKRHIEQNQRFKDYFEGDKCLHDPEGCLDFLILKSLQELPNETSTHIVAIDALDECIEYGQYNILHILLNRISKFPNYIKFLISSRNISSISQLSRHVNVHELMPESNKNERDNSLLVKEKMKYFNQEETQRIQAFFKTSDINEISDKAVRYGKANMLFVSHALKFWSENEEFSLQDPLTLETLFYIQLYRIFEKDEVKFSHSRKLMEILCASSEPLFDEEVFEIANISTDVEKMIVIKMLGNELSHFIRQTNGKMVILHKTLSDFLTKKDRRREQFYISKQNGCIQLSTYLLKKVHAQHSFKGIDILLLTTYVACTKNQEFKNTFLNYGKKYHLSIEYRTKSINQNSIFLLHRASLTMNSYPSMALFLDLYLKLPFTDVDEYDNGNITASYVAAAYGNHNTLNALLNYGADVNFTRKGPRIMNSTLNNIVEISKLLFQWKYNLLNIASQNGHLHIVRVLLRNKVNIKHKSACKLNSFHLASEFGHALIVKYFLMNQKSAFRSSLNFSLYLASRNGHEDIVRLLLYHGAVDACLPCSGKMYWTKFHQTRLQVIDNEFDFKTFNYICMDDKRMIRCETAIEIAIQNGHTEVVKRLLEYGTTSLQCREAGGRNPLLTAVRFDRREILQYFISLNVSFTQHCITAYQKRDNFDLSKAEEMEYDNNMCLNNMSTFHMVAEYGSSQNIVMMYDLSKTAFWTERDAHGTTPLHYLACRGRQELRSHFKTEYYVKSYNGSTPLHSAAICKQYGLLNYLLPMVSAPILDNNEQGVFHYLARSESFKNEVAKSVIDNCTHCDKSILKNIREELFTKDNMGRTALHYAAIHGNINFLQIYLNFNLNQEIWNSLLRLSDINNETILDLVFKNLPKIIDFPKTIPSKYCLPPLDIQCRNEIIGKMNSHQYFIFSVLETSFAKTVLDKKISMYIKGCFQRGNVLILQTMFTKFQQTLDSRNEFIVSLIDSFKILPTLDYIDPGYLIFLKKYNSDVMKCSCDYSKTFTFHKLMEDPKGSFRIHLSLFSLSKMNCEDMDFCYDAEGFNPLHRTVVSGNSIGFNFLINSGMSVNVKTKDGKDVLQLLVEYAPCIPDYLKIRASFSEDLSLSSTSLLPNIKDNNLPDFKRKRKHRYIEEYIVNETSLLKTRTAMQICDIKAKTLSFSHIAAAKGLEKILEAIKENFGEINFNCINHLNISTAYLLSVFSHNRSSFLDIKWVKNLNDASAALFLKFAYDFKTFVYPKGSVLWKCKQKLSNFENTNALLTCAAKAEEEFLLMISQMFKLRGLKSQHDYEEMCQVCKKYVASPSASDLECFGRQLISYWKNPEKYKYKYMMEYYMLETELKKLQGEIQHKKNSERCLLIIAKMKHLKRRCKETVLFKSALIPLLTITSLYEHEIMKPFSFTLHIKGLSGNCLLSMQRSILNSQIDPGYQSSKQYAYWDVLTRHGDIRSKKVVNAILNTPISEIRKWKGTFRSRLDFNQVFRTYQNDVFPSDIPLHEYEDLLKNATF